jgi:hypothetical protein
MELIQSVDSWKQMLTNVMEYIDTNQKRPTACSRNNYIKSMGKWIRQQKIYYKTRNNTTDQSNIMSTNTEIKILWEETINDPKYNPFLCFCLVENWKKNLESVRVNIIYRNGIRPSTFPYHIDDDESARLTRWMNKQWLNFQKNSNIIRRHPELRELWNKEMMFER